MDRSPESNGNGNGNGFRPEGAAAAVIEDFDADAVSEDGLPSDTEEFASPPTPVPFQPLEPEFA